MTTYVCGNCGKECELFEEDHGGLEEWWGVKVWHEMPTSVTDCCGETCFEEVDEEEEEEPEDDGQPDEAQEWHDFDPDC